MEYAIVNEHGEEAEPSFVIHDSRFTIPGCMFVIRDCLADVPDQNEKVRHQHSPLTTQS